MAKTRADAARTKKEEDANTALAMSASRNPGRDECVSCKPSKAVVTEV